MVTALKNLVVRLQRRQLLWDTVSTTILGAIGKGMGFMIPFFIARWFGATSETDAFFFAYGLIIFLSTIFSPVVESIIVPFIAEERVRGGDVSSFISSILCVSGLLMVAVATGIIAIDGILLHAFTSFSSNNIQLIKSIIFTSSPLLLLLVWTSVIAGSLNAFAVFSAPALSPAVRGIVTVTSIFILKSSLGVHAIAVGYVAGELVRLIVLFYVVIRSGHFRLNFRFSFGSALHSFIKASSFQIAGMTVLAFVPTVNKAMVSSLGPGNVSVLEYADRIYMIPVTFLSTGFLVTLLSHCSRNYSERGMATLRNDIHNSAKTVAVIGSCISLVLLMVKTPLVMGLYGKSVSPDRLALVSGMLTYYFVAITPYLLTQIYIRAFLIIKDTKMLLFMALFFSGGLILLNKYLISAIGLKGVAVSYVIQTFLALGILIIKFRSVAIQRVAALSEVAG